MAVAHDAATKSAEWQTTPDPFTFSHTPSGTPRGVVVGISSTGVSTDLITGVTYGGVAMARIVTGADTTGEPARSYLYFLGAAIPTGTQTVSVDHTGSSDRKIAVCATLTAGADTEVTNSGSLGVDQTNPQIAVSGTDALRYFHIFSGLPNVTDLTLISGMTAVHSHDIGANVVRFDRETSPSTGSTAVGYTSATDDVAMVALEIHEVAGAVADPPSPTISKFAVTRASTY